VRRALYIPALLVLLGLGVWWFRAERTTLSPNDPVAQERGGQEPVAAPVHAGSTPPSGRESGVGASASPVASGGADVRLSEELKVVVQSVRASLPKKQEMKPADDEAAHHAGPELIRAGQALGDLAEYLERRPEEFRSASVFYAECAADEALMPASRAVCYAALLKKKGEWAPGVAERISRVGPEIVDVARNLSE
jgi:hypothetical protein